jgi:hypothetical protein
MKSFKCLEFDRWQVRARIMHKGQFKCLEKQLALVAKWNLFSLL